MNYNFQAVPEATWAAAVAALTGLATAICISIGADDTLTVAVSAAVAALTRLVIGFVIPQPK